MKQLLKSLKKNLETKKENKNYDKSIKFLNFFIFVMLFFRLELQV